MENRKCLSHFPFGEVALCSRKRLRPANEGCFYCVYTKPHLRNHEGESAEGECGQNDQRGRKAGYQVENAFFAHLVPTSFLDVWWPRELISRSTVMMVARRRIEVGFMIA